MLSSGSGTSSRSQLEVGNLVSSGSDVSAGHCPGKSVLVAAGDDAAVAAGSGAGNDVFDADSAPGPTFAEFMVTSSLVFKPAAEAGVS